MADPVLLVTTNGHQILDPESEHLTGGKHFEDNVWLGQTFQLPVGNLPGTEDTIPYGSTLVLTSIVLFLSKYGSPGTITASIRATSDPYPLRGPVGGDLDADSIDGNGLSPTEWPIGGYIDAGSWETFTLGGALEYSPGEIIGITVRAPSAEYTYEEGTCTLGLWAKGYALTNAGFQRRSTDSGANFLNIPGGTDFAFELWGTVEPPGPPEKAITPGPTDANSAVTLDQEDLTWIDGGLGAANEALTFNVYYGDTSGSLTLVASAQDAGAVSNLFTIWNLDYGSPFDYAVTRYWRIDSTNDVGTTTGDEWSFTTLTFDPPVPSPPEPDPDDPYPIDYEFDPNFIRTTQRLVCACGHQIWYETS